MSSLKPHWPLAVVLLIYIGLAVAHSLVAPLTSGNDEWSHFQYVRFIAEHGRPPINRAERDDRAEVGTKGDDPPLYHWLTAAVTAGVEPVRLLRPVEGRPRRQLADNRVVSYAFLVHIGPERFPYRGEVLLWHLGRAVSIFFGAVAVGLTYWTGLALFARRRAALTAAAMAAFMPAFIFHSSMLSYDSLGAALTALFLLAAIRAIRHPERWRWWPVLGLLAGLAVTAKYSSVLLPLEILFVAWLASAGVETARRRWLWILKRAAVAGLAMLLAMSWWFGFVAWHFNTIDSRGPVVGVLEPLIVRDGSDTTALRVAAFLFGGESVSAAPPPPARPRHYPQLARFLLDSFWAGPVAERFVLSPWLPGLFTVMGLAALWRGWRRVAAGQRLWMGLLLCHALLILPLILVRLFLSYDPLEAVQGRHILLPGLSAIALLLAWDRSGLGRWLAAGLLLWSAIGQVGWAAAVYPPPMPVWAGQPPESIPPSRAEILLPGLRLAGADWAQSGQSLPVTLWWRAESWLTEDYLIELSLIEPESGRTVGYSLGQPVRGRYPTRAWESGDLIKDTHHLPLTGPLAGDYRLVLRLLDRSGESLYESMLAEGVPLSLPARPLDPCATWFGGQPQRGGPLNRPYRQRAAFTVISGDAPLLRGEEVERQPFRSAGDFHVFMTAPDWAERYQLVVGERVCGEIAFELPARDFSRPEIPQPVEANFNGEIVLAGYELPTRRIQPGQRLPLTLYWHALAYMGHDYRIFDNLLDESQQRWGGYDRRAKDGYSTLLWVPGEYITDRFGVPVDPAAPPGIYSLDVGLYRPTPEGGAVSLPLVVDGQPIDRHSVRLGPLKVGGPPPAWTVTDPVPQVRLDHTFGEAVALLGYDLAAETDSLTVRLYWAVAGRLERDYTTFVHLRGEESQIGRDRPPPYPTSLWDAGEVVLDEVTVGDIPPGDYRLVVGLYHPPGGERLPVSGVPANELFLEEVSLP